MLAPAVALDGAFIGACAGALVSIPLYLLTTWGLPRGGEVARGSRPAADSWFRLALAVMGIALLAFMPLARGLLVRLEPFASSRALLEWACAVAHVVIVLPLLALAGAEALGAPDRAAAATALRRFVMGLTPMLTLQACILLGARSLGSPAPVQSVLADFEAQPWAVRAPLACLVVVAAPFVEETLFRGTLHPALSRVAGAPASRLATAVLFGALHGEYAAVPMGLFGYFLARVRDADGRLLPCVAIHGLYNGLTLTLYTLLPQVRGLYGPA